MYSNSDFKGPTHLSHKVYFQNGDQSQNSNDSLVYQQPFLGVNISKKSDAESDEILQGKPYIRNLTLLNQIQETFINNLWNHTYLRKLHQLTSYQILQIDDLQIETSKVVKSIIHFWNLIEVFTPYNKFVMFWNLFLILTHLLIFFWLPYRISFETQTISELYSDQSNYSIEIVIILILLLDIAVGINMAFIKKGQLVKMRMMILHNYVNQSAFVELVQYSYIQVSFFAVAVQFLIPNLNQETNFMIFIECLLCFEFYLLRIAKINKILASIKEFFNLSGYLNDLVGLLKVLMVIVGVVHIFGCFWHAIAFYNTQYSWLDAYNLRNHPNISKYNIAIYWATMTMTTVGYGDITAKNDLELLVNNLTMIFGSIVFAYSVNSIGIFVQNMYKGQIEHSKTVSLINTFMSKNQIQFELQTKIRSYLEYIQQEEQNINDEQVGSIILKLSKNLQDEIQYQLRGNILKQCKTLVKLFSESFLKDLLHYMEEQSYSPEERIISMGEKDDCALYIITKGEVELIYEGLKLNEKVKKNILKTYGQFDSFGEVAFITGNLRTLTAISNDFTKVMKIKRDSFLSIIKSFPDDYEKYCDVKDKSSFNDFSKLHLNCYSCQSKVHLVDKCNYIHFCSDKEKVIKKELYPVIQIRNRFFKRKVNKIIQNSLAALEQITKSAKELNIDLILQADDHESPFEEEENQIINRKSLTDSMLHNMYISQQQEQDIQRTAKQEQTIQTAGFGMPEAMISNRCVVNKFDTISSVASSEQFDQMPNINPNSKKQIIPILNLPRRSMQNFRQLSEMYENQKFHRKSIELNNQLNLRLKQNQTLEQINKKKLQQYQIIIIQIISQMVQVRPIFKKLLILTKYVHILSIHLFTTLMLFQKGITILQKRYIKVQKYFSKKKIQPDYSLYAFSQIAIKKGWKLRRLSQLSKVKTPLRRKQLGSSQRSLFFKI